MLREGVINTQREGRGGVCTGSSTLRESFENRFVCISPVKNPFENRFVCISPAKNPFENRFVCTFLVKNPFENRFVCIFPVKDPFENPFGSRFTLCPALIYIFSVTNTLFLLAASSLSIKPSITYELFSKDF